MDALLVRIAERITSGADPLLSPSEALELARLPESATLDILSVAGLARAARKPAAAFTCGIINAKSGRCPENCAFCAQSAHHQTDSPVYPLYDTDTLLRRAEELAANNVDRFGIVTSGTAPSDRDFDALCESALRIGREVKIGLCASLGLLTPERAARLHEAGFTSSQSRNLREPFPFDLYHPRLRAGSGNRARGPLRRVPGVQLRHLRPWRDVGAAY